MNLYRCRRAQRWGQRKKKLRKWNDIRPMHLVVFLSFAMEACEMRVKSTFRVIYCFWVVVHHFKSVVATDFTIQLFRTVMVLQTFRPCTMCGSSTNINVYHTLSQCHIANTQLLKISRCIFRSHIFTNTMKKKEHARIRAKGEVGKGEVVLCISERGN